MVPKKIICLKTNQSRTKSKQKINIFSNTFKNITCYMANEQYLVNGIVTKIMVLIFDMLFIYLNYHARLI